MPRTSWRMTGRAAELFKIKNPKAPAATRNIEYLKVYTLIEGPIWGNG